MCPFVVLVSCSGALVFLFSLFLRSAAQILWNQVIMTITLFTAMCAFFIESSSFVLQDVNASLRDVRDFCFFASCLFVSFVTSTFHLRFQLVDSFFRFVHSVFRVSSMLLFSLFVSLFLLLFNVFR